MDPKSIQSIWKAFQEVQEAKNKKKEALDPVGKEDDDVDNDGDTDSSDEYLKNRRKKIGKSMKKDDERDVKESEESPYPSLDKKKREKKGSNLEPAGGPADKLKGESVEEKTECPKCKGEGCDHCEGKGYHMAKKEACSGKKMKESALFTAAELEAIEEKANAEPFMSTNSAGEKAFYADHQKSDKKFEDMEDVSEKDGSNAGKAVKSQSPTRRGEKRTGDIAMPTPTKAKGQ